MDRGGTITWILDADDAAFLRSMLRAREESKRTARVVNRNLKDTDSELEKLRKKISITANVARDFQTVMMGFNMTSFIAGVVAAGAAVIELSGAVIAAAGSVVALPGIFASVGASAATTRVALIGLEDAFKAVLDNDPEKLAEAMKKLSPAAKEFVTAFDKVNDLFKPVQQAIQQKFFENLGKEMLDTATVSMPVLRRGMESVAIATNGLLREVARVAREPFFQGFIAKVLDTTAQSTKTLTGAVEPLTVALTGLVQVGLPYTNMLADFIVKQSQLAAAYVSSQKGQEQLTNVINIGLDALQKIFELAGALSGVLVSLFQLSNKEGLSFIGTVTEALNKFNEFLKSAEGQEKFSTLFKVSNEILTAAIDVIARVGKVVLDLFDAIDKLPGPMREFVINLAATGIVMAPIIGYATTLGVSLRALFLSMGAGVRTIIGIVNGLRAMGAAFMFAQAGATAIQGGAFVQMGVIFSNILNVMRTVWVFISSQFIPALIRLGAAWLVAIGPIGWIAIAIAAVVAAFVWLWNNVEGFRNFWIDTWNTISNFVNTAVTNIIEYFKPLTDTITTIFNGIKDTATTVINSVVDIFKGPIDTIGKEWEKIRTAFDTAINPIKTTVEGIIGEITKKFDELKTTIQPMIDTIKKVFDDLVNTIKPVVDEITKFITQSKELQLVLNILGGILLAVVIAPLAILAAAILIIIGVVVGIGLAILFVVAKFLEFANYVISGKMWEDFKNVISGVGQWFSDRFNDALNFIYGIFAGIGKWFEDRYNDIKNVFAGIGKWFSDKFNDVKTGIENKFNEVVKWVGDVPKNIVAALGNVGNLLKDAGKSIIDGFFNGLKESYKKVTDFVGGIADWIAKNKGPLNYDKRLLEPAGNAIMEGLFSGLDDGFGKVQNLVSSMGGNLSDTFQSSLGQFGDRSFSASVNGNMTGDPQLAPASIGAQDMPSQSGTSNGVQVNQYNTVNTEIDMDQVIRDMTWELGRA